MGARSSDVYGSFWTDPDVREMSYTKKLLLLFLMTYHPPTGGLSGIYIVSLKDIAYLTGIPLEQVEAIFEEGIKNVAYHTETSTIFLKNKFEYNRIGGNPQLVAKSIWGDMKMTYKARSIWLEWRARYTRFVEKSTLLTEAFTDLISDTPLRSTAELEASVAPVVRPLATETKEVAKLPKDQQAQRENELENKISTLFERYIEVPPEDRDRLNSVFVHITQTPKGKLMTASRRFVIFEECEKEPLPKMCRAAFEFIKADGIEQGMGWPYFRGILRNSAHQWWLRVEHEQDKAFELTTAED